MIRVAVSQRVDFLASRGEYRDSLDQRLIAFVAAGGGLALPVPNILAASGQLAAWIDAVRPDAVVLSGGNDIGHCADRDHTERLLLDHAASHRLPVLGICRGMQMMGCWAGAGLRPATGHVRTVHRLLGQLTGPANSFHNHVLAGCPAGFEVIARSEDASIEAIRHNEWPWEGWMWHPEREAVFAARDLERLKALMR